MKYCNCTSDYFVAVCYDGDRDYDSVSDNSYEGCGYNYTDDWS